MLPSFSLLVPRESSTFPSVWSRNEKQEYEKYTGKEVKHRRIVVKLRKEKPHEKNEGTFGT